MHESLHLLPTTNLIFPISSSLGFHVLLPDICIIGKLDGSKLTLLDFQVFIEFKHLLDTLHPFEILFGGTSALELRNLQLNVVTDAPLLSLWNQLHSLIRKSFLVNNFILYTNIPPWICSCMLRRSWRCLTTYFHALKYSNGPDLVASRLLALERVIGPKTCPVAPWLHPEALQARRCSSRVLEIA
ncbi:hypothetical protein CRG98_008372 [Punica granatum]|uniref:Uncharacterized protein n=1 Tax=Punica granatum TaxID=22663 RepID=A0A2I0KRU8_PUNGR|nr:hypothetical protein CRG98_008372 [Punica granatum]